MSSLTPQHSKKELEQLLKVYRGAFLFYLVLAFGDIALGTSMSFNGAGNNGAIWFFFATLWFFLLAKNRSDRNKVLKVLETKAS